MDSYTSVDALIGKATRKARAWLISTLTGVEVVSADVTDSESIVVDSKPLDVEGKKEEMRNKEDGPKVNMP